MKGEPSTIIILILLNRMNLMTPKTGYFDIFSQNLSLLFQLISTPSPNYEEGTYEIQRFGS